MASDPGEEDRLREVALRNASSILAARRRAEEELLRAKDELRDTAERLKLALAAGQLGYWSWRATDDVTTLDERAADILGIARGAVVTWEQLGHSLHPEDREATRVAVENALAGKGDYDVEYRVMHADGDRWVAARGRGTYGPGGEVLGMTGIVHDITSRRLTELALQAARLEAERASQLKDDFLATLSHELRTPLSAILGWSQVLARKAEPGSDVQKGLETIERNARLQTQLIEDLLDISRITSGKVRLDIQPVEPMAVIEAALESARPAAEAKGIRLERLLDPSTHAIAGDPSRLQQVIWNLLSNAIKFTPRGGKVQVILARVNSHVEVSVADTGMGIDPEFLPQIFQRFQQADASTTRQYSGLGLGLSIVKHLVELHGGTVRARSPGKDQGSTFTVHLPLAAVHRRGAGEARHPSAPPQATPYFALADLSGLRVLVVDDEPDARDLVRRVLTDCRAEVTTAGSADEALKSLESDQPHVIVSDIGMPEIDGYEFLRRVRHRGLRIPAIALTAFARSEDRTRALRAGFLVHVAKPVEPSELAATVASVTGRAGEVWPPEGYR